MIISGGHQNRRVPHVKRLRRFAPLPRRLRRYQRALRARSTPPLAAAVSPRMQKNCLLRRGFGIRESCEGQPVERLLSLTELAMAAVAAAFVAAGDVASAPVTPPTRTDLLLVDQEMRECYRAATLLSDGNTKRGRKTKHDTATRRWIDTVGFPNVSMGKMPAQSDLAMMRSSPRSSLSGPSLVARDAWSQLHGRDPRSKKQTAAEKQHQTTLLAWARTNMPDALTPATVRRGRVASWQFDFGTWKGYSPTKLALAASEVGCSGTSRSLPANAVAAGAYLTWITGQAGPSSGQAFKWRFPSHFYLYLAMRDLELQGRAVKGNTGPILLKLPAAVHRQYEAWADIRLGSADAEDGVAGAQPPRQGSGEDAEGEEPVAGALRVPLPLPPVDPIESATPPAQREFFKSILTDIANGDRPEYQEWEQLTVWRRAHPQPVHWCHVAAWPRCAL